MFSKQVFCGHILIEGVYFNCLVMRESPFDELCRCSSCDALRASQDEQRQGTQSSNANRKIQPHTGNKVKTITIRRLVALHRNNTPEDGQQLTETCTVKQ
jgi:hypothetical protein